MSDFKNSPDWGKIPGIHLRDIRVTFQQVKETFNRLGNNETIAEYYNRMYDEYGNDTYQAIAERIKSCNSYWVYDRYRAQNVLDLKTINLCHSRFCSNCQKLMQATRLYRFTPQIEQSSKDYDVFHITFTIPNMPGKDLKSSIDTMVIAFRRIIRYFAGDLKIKELEFEQYGYVGAIRSLEVTYKIIDSYHPHFHCMIAFAPGSVDNEKKHINEYSFDYGIFKRKFSDFEILIQKIWRLLIDKMRVTMENIESLPIGYSCTADLIGRDSYYEAFKYAFKTSSDEGAFLSYEQFRYIYDALYKRRCIQGYGIFYNISCSDEIDLLTDEKFSQIIDMLKSVEKPVEEHSNVPDLMSAMTKEDFIIISRKNIQKYIIEEMKENEQSADLGDSDAGLGAME